MLLLTQEILFQLVGCFFVFLPFPPLFPLLRIDGFSTYVVIMTILFDFLPFFRIVSYFPFNFRKGVGDWALRSGL